MEQSIDFIAADELDHVEDFRLDPLTQMEMELLLDAVARRYGYDFRQYSDKMLRRRLSLFRRRCGAEYFSELIPKLLHDPEMMQQLLLTMSVTVTEFFRDPHFFAAFKQHAVPLLRTYAFISLWCAGCATGEEAYSWAILLEEAGLLERARIYATDINNQALQEGRNGVYGEDQYQRACENYRLMGGKYEFDHYCQHSYGAIKMAGRLQKHITFAQHNLAHDGVFGETVVVSCRNVMIYFSAALKQRSMDLFYKSLCHQGFLCLGDCEATDATDFGELFQPSDKRHRIYQKTYAPPG